MRFTTLCFLVALPGVFTLDVPAAHRDGALPLLAEAEDLNSATTAPTSSPQLPSLPKVQLDDPIDDGQESQAALEQRLADLESKAQGATSSLSRCDAFLEAANLLLARQTEPASSRLVLRIDDGADPDELAVIKKSFDRATQWLNQAEQSLESTTNEMPLDMEQFQLRTAALETLRAFESALRVLLMPQNDNDKEGMDAREAASVLAPLFETPDHRLAAAAKLYYAELRNRSGEPAKLLPVLDSVLEDVTPDSLPYTFFVRVLRCRLVAQNGGYAAALALLYQLEERCRSWFESATERDSALCAVSLAEIQILRDWYRSLEQPQLRKEREWCAARIQAIADYRFSGKNSTVLRLQNTIPLQVFKPTPQTPVKTPVTEETSTKPENPENKDD